MKKSEIIAIILIALIAPVCILWENSFPVFDYYINKANNHGIFIKKKELGDKTFLLNPYYKNQPFSKVELDVKFSDDFLLQSNNQIKISVFENYESLAYPKEGEITTVEELRSYLYYNNQSNLPNGTIFSNGESVFFVSQGEYRPILSKDIFEKLGFDWDVLVPQETGIFSLLEEGEKIVFNSAHPDGVILSIDNEYYLVWEEKLIKIKDRETLKDVWKDFYVVSASELSELDSCIVTLKENNSFNCNFDVVNSNEINQPYIFKFNQGGLSQEIIEAHTQLKVSAKIKDMKKSFMILLSNTKDDFSKKYGDYLL